MKKVFLLILSVSLFGCSKSSNSSDSSTTGDNSQIVGTWKLTTINGVSLSSCAATYPNLVINSNGTGREGSGRLNVSNVCVDDSRNFTYTVESGNVFYYKENNFVFQNKRTITLSGNNLKLKVFWVKQSGPNGQIYEDNIPVGQQKEYNYTKI